MKTRRLGRITSVLQFIRSNWLGGISIKQENILVAFREGIRYAWEKLCYMPLLFHPHKLYSTIHWLKVIIVVITFPSLLSFQLDRSYYKVAFNELLSISSLSYLYLILFYTHLSSHGETLFADFKLAINFFSLKTWNWRSTVEGNTYRVLLLITMINWREVFLRATTVEFMQKWSSTCNLFFEDNWCFFFLEKRQLMQVIHIGAAHPCTKAMTDRAHLVISMADTYPCRASAQKLLSPASLLTS